MRGEGVQHFPDRVQLISGGGDSMYPPPLFMSMGLQYTYSRVVIVRYTIEVGVGLQNVWPDLDPNRLKP